MEKSTNPVKDEGSFVNAAGQVIRWRRSAEDPFKFHITIDNKPIDWNEVFSHVKGK